MNTATHHITNESGEPLNIWFEPWGVPLVLPPHAQFRLEAHSDEPGDLHIERLPQRIVVYAWAGSTIEVFNGSNRLSEYIGDFPALPPGLSVKDFVSSMFGDPPPLAEGKADLN